MDGIFFVIPAYNEAKSLPRVLSEIHKKGYKNIVVIDDGSKDNTSEIIPPYVTYLRHVINRGQGAALRTGIEYALKQKSCKYIVTFDSDGQHRLSDLPNLLEPLEQGKCDIALGSRFLQKSSQKLVPRNKRIVLKVSVFVTWLLSGISLTDTHNGYRVMNKNAASKIHITMDGFEHASEILDEIARKHIKYVEVPVHIDYTEYSKQKGQKISNAFRIFFRMLFK